VCGFITATIMDPYHQFCRCTHVCGFITATIMDPYHWDQEVQPGFQHLYKLPKPEVKWECGRYLQERLIHESRAFRSCVDLKRG